MPEERTFLQKLDNIWYHYKWWILFAVFLIIVASYSIWSAVTRKDYDYTVSYIGHGAVSFSQLDEIAEALVPYGTDINADGEVTIDVQGYNMGLIYEDPSSYAANIVSIQDDFKQGRTMLFILDKQSFEYFQQNYGYFGNLDGSSADGSMDIEKMGWNWQDTALYGRLAYAGLPEDRYLVMRTVEGTKLSGNKEAEKKLAEAVELFRTISAANEKEQDKIL